MAKISGRKYKKSWFGLVISLVCIIYALSNGFDSGENGEVNVNYNAVSISDIPEYSGDAFVVVNEKYSKGKKYLLLFTFQI